MKVFLSWSGHKSHKIAIVFRDWFPSVIQSIVPYVSSEDIDKGARWSTDIAKELEDSTFGILCVTKENINAPWLTFEAGALSKTIEKSFVCPFLFDIKRSEVDGPILQFQSTIFDREDIKKLVKTLNTACGEDALTEQRLEKAFDVWYPTLEEELNKVKGVKDEPKEEKPPEHHKGSEILEEILELSRINQKLLRNPDPILSETIQTIKKQFEEQNMRFERMIMHNDIRLSRRFPPILIEEIIHISRNRSNPSYSVLMLLGLLRNEFPWLYDIGREVLSILKSKKAKNEKQNSLEEFKRILELTFEHPMFRDLYAHNKDIRMFYRELSRALATILDELQNELI